MPVITLVNEGKSIEVTEGANLRKALLKNGVNPYVGKDKLLNCLGHGLCGTCRVEVVDGKGAPAITAMEEAALLGLVPLYARAVPKHTRLACRIDVTKDMTIKTYPKAAIDFDLTKERLTLSAIWVFFGGIFTYVLVRLLIEIATGR